MKEKKGAECCRQRNESNILMNFTFLLQRKTGDTGSRCMDCGVPFCQSGMMIKGMASGCPLHNLVPEWNDLIIQETGNRHIRLKKTNNFPEFTGRVCPALCENACTCGLNGDPVHQRK